MSKEIQTPMMDMVHRQTKTNIEKPTLYKSDDGKERLLFCSAPLSKSELKQLISELQHVEKMMKE